MADAGCLNARKKQKKKKKWKVILKKDRQEDRGQVGEKGGG